MQFFFKIISQGQKYGHFLLNCMKTPVIVLEVSTVIRFQNIICIANPEKENKILYALPYEEMGAATIDF